MMKKIALLFALMIFPLLLSATPVGPMSYQGRLLNDQGVPVTGSYNFTVRIYDDPVAGALVYEEVHSNVTVNDGVYSFRVGTQTPQTGSWDLDLWQNNINDLYLELHVGAETLSPRTELTSSPHAFTSTLALAADTLGGKTAAEYDNILEGVCVASKGKWLDLVDQCLGASSSFPGPSVSSWSTLSSDSDFSNLDLSNADISGISFMGADLSGSTFYQTTYRVSGIAHADIGNTYWDGAVATDSSAYLIQTSQFNIKGASFKNMDMSKWHFQLSGGGSAHQGMSAAYLSACPVLTPIHGWECRLMRSGGSEYFLVGTGANLSNTSALSIAGFNGSVLDIDNDALDNIYLGGASFAGSTIVANLSGSSLYQADMSYSVIRNAHFTSGTSFTGTNLTGAHIEQSIFETGSSIGANFQGARLNNVQFLDDVVLADFTNAYLREVYFDFLSVCDFTSATLEDVHIDSMRSTSASPYYTTFDKTRIYGLFQVDDHYGGYPNFDHLIYQDLEFIGATLSGNFSGVTFTNSVSFKHVVLDDLNLNNAVIPLVDTTAPHNDLSTVTWGAVRCPDGTVVSGGTGANSCDYLLRMTP